MTEASGLSIQFSNEITRNNAKVTPRKALISKNVHSK